MNAVCLVAHPDDCIIFAYPFIYNHFKYNWNIVYLTYDKEHPRSKEVQLFWKNRGISTTFLGFWDNTADMFTQKLSFSKEFAIRAVCNAVKHYDFILTHNKDGDTGHIHHKFLYECVSDADHVVTFSKTYHEDWEYLLPRNAYNYSEIPLHSLAVSSCHGMDSTKDIRCLYEPPANLKIRTQIVKDKYTNKGR